MASNIPKPDPDTLIPRGFPNFDLINYLKILAIISITRFLYSKPKGAKSRPISLVCGGECGDNTWDAGHGIYFRLKTHDIT